MEEKREIKPYNTIIKKIPRTDVYISTDGRAYQELKDGSLREKKQSINTVGKKVVSIRYQEYTTTRDVGTLVAEIFIPNPYHATRIQYIDGNIQNNIVENIRWTKPSKETKRKSIEDLEKEIEVLKDILYKNKIEVDRK